MLVLARRYGFAMMERRRSVHFCFHIFHFPDHDKRVRRGFRVGRWQFRGCGLMRGFLPARYDIPNEIVTPKDEPPSCLVNRAKRSGDPVEHESWI